MSKQVTEIPVFKPLAIPKKLYSRSYYVISFEVEGKKASHLFLIDRWKKPYVIDLRDMTEGERQEFVKFLGTIKLKFVYNCYNPDPDLAFAKEVYDVSIKEVI